MTTDKEIRDKADKLYPRYPKETYSTAYTVSKREREAYESGYKSALLYMEGEAIGFTEWLSSNEWVKRIHTHPNKIGKYWSHIHCEYKAIAELLSIYRKEKALTGSELTTNNKQNEY